MKTKLSRNGLFITGAGTGVGKTYIAAYLATALSKLTKVSYFKPVQTGCAENVRGILRAPDFDFVARHAPLCLADYELHVPYRFRPSCSPHLAARMQGTIIDRAVICDAYYKLTQSLQNAIIIVEGAGGVFTPIGETDFLITIIKDLGLPAVLVTRNYLGTLNHTVLSIEALRKAGCGCAAVIMNETGDDLQQTEEQIRRDNIEYIARYCSPIPFLSISAGEQPGKEAARFCARLLEELHGRSI